MTDIEKENERRIGYNVGWNDCQLWIADNKDGIIGAIATADDKLALLMEQEGVPDIVAAEKKVGPYLFGLMKAYEEFIQRHYSDLK